MLKEILWVNTLVGDLAASYCPLQVYLGYNNIAALTVMAGKQGWEPSSIQNKVNTHT